jgi:hypothetical protein
MISDCASSVWHFERAAVSLQFVAPQFEGSSVLDFLEYLAVVEPYAEGTPQAVPELPYDAHSLIFTASEWRVDSAGTVLTYSSAADAANPEQRI